MTLFAVLLFAAGLLTLLLGLVGIIKPIVPLHMPTRKHALAWSGGGIATMIAAAILSPSATKTEGSGGKQELEQRREAAVQNCLQDDKYASQAECATKVRTAFEQRRQGMSDALSMFQLCSKEGTGCPDVTSLDLPYSCQSAFAAAGLALDFQDVGDRKRKWADVTPTKCIDEMALWGMQAKPVFDALATAANRPG